MVDLLERHRREGRRFQPVEFIEEGRRIAVGLNVSDVHWPEGEVQVFKVFTFPASGDRALLLEDCAGRDDALAHLTAV